MATASKSKSFQRNLLFSIGGVFLLFAVCFSVYQYQREKEYKIDILHSRLQMYNYEMVQTLGEDSLTNNRLFCDYVERHNMEGLRVSIIDKNGRVILDSYEPQVDSLGNHLEAIHPRDVFLFSHSVWQHHCTYRCTIFGRVDAFTPSRQYLHLLCRCPDTTTGHRALPKYPSHQPSHRLSARVCCEG